MKSPLISDKMSPAISNDSYRNFGDRNQLNINAGSNLFNPNTIENTNGYTPEPHQAKPRSI